MTRSMLIDLDGVVYEGDEPVAGSIDALGTLARKRVPYLFVTNTTSRPRAAIATQLRALGLDVPATRILTPPVAARAWLDRHAPGPALLLVPPATWADFNGISTATPDPDQEIRSVVVGDLAEDWTFRRLNEAFRALMREVPPAFVALGMTRYWRTSDGLQLDAGPFVKALEFATGRTATVLGKPSPAFFATALELLGARAGDTSMIGDDIVGDIDGAQRAGLRGVLVRTGKFRPVDLDGSIRPDAVIDSLAALPGHLGL
jgi:HAD superfamily hydrolase (TIGR01458 family)